MQKTDALADKKESGGDDGVDGGASSAELIAPNPISSSASGQSDPSITAWGATLVLLTSKRGCKHPLLAPKRNRPLD
jgi:hypothetical protein